MRQRKRLKPPKGGKPYWQLWRIVDGAVKDAFDQHPDYLAVPQRYPRYSVVKRVTGAIMGYAAQKAAKGRSG